MVFQKQAADRIILKMKNTHTPGPRPDMLRGGQGPSGFRTTDSGEDSKWRGPGKRTGSPQAHWGASLATLRAFVSVVGPGGFPHSSAGDRGICITAAGWLPVPACGVDAGGGTPVGEGAGGGK